MKEVYQCEKCKEVYDNRDKCETCERGHLVLTRYNTKILYNSGMVLPNSVYIKLDEANFCYLLAIDYSEGLTREELLKLRQRRIINVEPSHP